MQHKLNIMVVNDSEEVLNLFYDILHEEEGHAVSLFSYRIRDLDEVRNINPDLLIVDQVYGKEHAGWELIQKVRMSRDISNLPIVFCTTDLRRVQELEGHLATMNVVVVIKPFTVDALLSAVASASQGRMRADRSADAPSPI